MVQRDQVPEEVMDEELWLLHVNALEDALRGRDNDYNSFLHQADFDFANDVTMATGGEVVTSVRAPGGDQLQGQAVSTGQYSLRVRWLDDDGNIVRDEGISSNTEANRWANFSLSPKSPFADIVVQNDSGAEQTVNMTTHYR